MTRTRSKRGGKSQWVCEVAVSDDGETQFINAMPTYGRAHDPYPGCWCDPELIDENDYQVALAHRADH